MSRVHIVDPFEQEVDLEVGEQHEQYAAAGNRPFYVWAGRKYPRVTKVLSIAPGERLMHYSAKVAALSAAAPLIHAGMFVPSAQPPMEGRTPEYDALDTIRGANFEPWSDFDFDDGTPTHDEAIHAETMAELEKYIDALPMRELTAEQAIKMACDWVFNMKAPDRYRDHKARIGSLAHFYKHELAMGFFTQPPTVEYLVGLAWTKNVVPEDVLTRYAELGKDKESVILDLAHHALPHAENVFSFVERFKPEYEMVGLEALVVNTDEEYAGSLDDWAIYRQDVWREADQGRWPFDPAKKTARLIADLKTSNYLSTSVRFQLAAYAKASFVGLLSDRSERALPEFDGMLALHSKPNDGMAVQKWDDRDIETCFQTFCGLNVYFRGMQKLPRAKRGRQAKAPKKGERECPIMIGGGF